MEMLYYSYIAFNILIILKYLTWTIYTIWDTFVQGRSQGNNNFWTLIFCIELVLKKMRYIKKIKQRGGARIFFLFRSENIGKILQEHYKIAFVVRFVHRRDSIVGFTSHTLGIASVLILKLFGIHSCAYSCVRSAERTHFNYKNVCLSVYVYESFS